MNSDRNLKNACLVPCTSSFRSVGVIDRRTGSGGVGGRSARSRSADSACGKHSVNSSDSAQFDQSSTRLWSTLSAISANSSWDRPSVAAQPRARINGKRNKAAVRKLRLVNTNDSDRGYARRERERDIADASAQALCCAPFHLTLIVAVVLSLVSSALIVWLYVGRNLIARLTLLSDRMLALLPAT